VLNFHPLTPERWPDLEQLFGPKGACCGCWCMYWRLLHKQFKEQTGNLNQRNLKALVDSGAVPGILAYADETPVGWCSLAPREEFPRLGRSRILKPLDDQPVWSVVCFFVAKGYRKQGLTIQLLKTAVNFAQDNGAHIVEGYPIEPKSGKSPDAFVYTGLASAFQQAGFIEIARRSETRPIMRYTIKT
jgi:GNAT superfamily N-acetyltransferase